MRIRIQYLLIILLYVMTGVLCREYAPQPEADHMVSQFTQTQQPHAGEAYRYFIHSIFTSDISDNTIPEDYAKTPVKYLDMQGGCPPHNLVSLAIPPAGVIKLHPDAKEYYILSLRKIRI